ncbi:MAG TPA: hydrogenase expression/formation protein HypE [Methanomassiliicoccales archaeon]|nr:hydrogenase expression/formation protein HypE [Methanomassiliicoccales archaeon]
MKRVTMGHGAGGEMMQELIVKSIAPFLPKIRTEVSLESYDDSAVVDGVLFTTDGHTVKPIFYPGGDIGSLAVSGTVNDIAVMGGKALALSNTMILEEGLEIEVLERVMKSIGRYSEISGVPVVTGDTKVMEKGAIDEMVVVASAIGKRHPSMDHNLEVASSYRKVDSRWLTDDNVRDGDIILASGTMGDHGIALLSFREGYGFESEVQSDCAPLNHMIGKLLGVGGMTSMKDATRGGFANAINEWCSKSKIGIELVEKDIPIAEAVRNASEMLGLDPLTIGNEGKVIIACVPEMAEEVLKALRADEHGRNAAIIGKASKNTKHVMMRTEVGGRRILEPPVGDPVPRIC